MKSERMGRVCVFIWEDGDGRSMLEVREGVGWQAGREGGRWVGIKGKGGREVGKEEMI